MKISTPEVQAHFCGITPLEKVTKMAEATEYHFPIHQKSWVILPSCKHSAPWLCFLETGNKISLLEPRPSISLREHVLSTFTIRQFPKRTTLAVASISETITIHVHVHSYDMTQKSRNCTQSSIASDVSETYAEQDRYCWLICSFFYLEVNPLRFYTSWIRSSRALVVSFDFDFH